MNQKIKKVLLLGSGALQIGQAGEFDYSGSQAIKALKEEGIKVILVNPNIATIQTSENFADQVYFLPVEPHFVEEVIKKEKPQGILLSFGGQTALNCGLALEGSGVFEKYGVKVLGTPTKAIEMTEDRHKFSKMLSSIDLLTAQSFAVTTLSRAKKAAQQIGFPVMVRGGYSLGGQDSGVAYSMEDLENIAKKALAKTSQILIEESLAGWKEVEYEVVRDKYDNCITVCNMENIDPMGIHTGESVVVAPSQTLNNFEYHKLREIAIKTIRHLGIIGECNIQYALNPNPASSRVFASDPPSVIASEASNIRERGEADITRSETTKQSQKKIDALANGARNDGFDNSLDYRIIEVNARLSRSSALASKATGYPLAYVAAKLGLGYGLTEIKNSVTKKTIACFEPALDYLVVKFPRWDLGKFIKSQPIIGSSMQSVGEVMAIGRNFEETIQKAVRMLDIGVCAVIDESLPESDYKLPTPWRIFKIAQALKDGTDVEKISNETKIDKFFLEKLKNIADFENKLIALSHPGGSTAIDRISRRDSIDTKNRVSRMTKDLLLEAKRFGFSDKRIAKLTGDSEEKVRERRKELGIHPFVKQIDTLAAEYPAETNYLYLTYNGEKDDILSYTPGVGQGEALRTGMSMEAGKQVADNRKITNTKYTEPIHIIQGKPCDPEGSNQILNNKYSLKGKSENALLGIGNLKFEIGNSDNRKIIVLGSGPYRIGSSVEFDWCSVTCAQTAQEYGYETIIINCNPETVSTDYDMADKLYFEELTTETVLEIYRKENPLGLIVSMGGQTPNNLAIDLANSRAKILGTTQDSIDSAEDRNKFSELCDKLEIDQPEWATQRDISSAVAFADKIGYPVLVRPSYVLSGVAFNIATNAQDLESYLHVASKVSNRYPVVISKFIENAKEIEIDAVAQEGRIIASAISEHVENAGVHSGDATLVLPAQKVYLQTKTEIERIADKIAGNLKITGPFNIQFLAKENKVMVIECNLRASRSFPFVSKVSGINFIKAATLAILEPKSEMNKLKWGNHHVGIKAPQFSFARIRGADPVLRVEMSSTGEVACFGDDIYEAFLKSQLATGVKMPKKSVFVSIGGDENKLRFLESAKLLAEMDLEIYATSGTSMFLKEHGIKNTMLYKIHEDKKPTVIDYLTTKKIDLVINIFDPYEKSETGDGYVIRRCTIDFGIPLLTNLQTADLFVQSISQKTLSDLKALSWENYVKTLIQPEVQEEMRRLTTKFINPQR